MALSRRRFFQGAGALTLLAGRLAAPAFAQPAPAGDIPPTLPPILFVHGNGDHAALWMTTLWRMESNGVPRERMAAINFTDPLARSNAPFASSLFGIPFTLSPLVISSHLAPDRPSDIVSGRRGAGQRHPATWQNSERSLQHACRRGHRRRRPSG